MKKIIEMLQNMKAKNEKKDNKGFSLVELIIVIAIMAILVGIVGTQVLPYINKSKEAKDFQIINSYGTAATTAYSSNAEKVQTNITFKVYAPGSDTTAVALSDEIKELTGYDSIDDLAGSASTTGKMASKKGKTIAEIQVSIDLTNKKITTQAYSDAACSTGKEVFDAIVTEL